MASKVARDAWLCDDDWDERESIFLEVVKRYLVNVNFTCCSSDWKWGSGVGEVVEFGSFPHSDISDFIEKLILRADHIPLGLYENAGRSQDNISTSRDRTPRHHNDENITFKVLMSLDKKDALQHHSVHLHEALPLSLHPLS